MAKFLHNLSFIMVTSAKIRLHPGINYILRFNNGNTRTRHENMLKISNKDTRTTSADFEQVNVRSDLIVIEK